MEATAYLVLATFNGNMDFWFGGVFESEDEAMTAWGQYIADNAGYDIQFLNMVQVSAARYASDGSRYAVARLRT